MNAAFRKQTSENHSFNELALSYVASHASTLTDSQLHRRLDHLSAHLLGFFGAQTLTDISPTKLQKFTYYLESQGLKPKEIQSCLVSFRVCLKHAINKRWDVNPALLQPVAYADVLNAEAQQLSEQEFINLYQDLLSDMTDNLFH